MPVFLWNHTQIKLGFTRKVTYTEQLPPPDKADWKPGF